MSKMLTLFVLLAALAISSGKDEPAATAKPEELPTVDACIPPSVSNLVPPAVFPFPSGLVTAVTAANEAAQTHTVQGLNHLHGGWEFEAMRHFAVAMKADPRCLMAHWGMVISMLTPSPETNACRLAVSTRMLHLIDDGEGTELERGYAYGLVKYLEDGSREASDAFREVSNRFPEEMQAAIFAALFGRTGYDELGSATPDQKIAEERLLKLIKTHPESALPVYALLSICAEAPDLGSHLEYARRLCRLSPDYAPYHHILGHYEWRCGEHTNAVASFGRAASLYSKWMKINEASLADCDGWVRAECYRVVAMASTGDFENALVSAKKVAAIDPDIDRPSATGTRQLLWDAKTLPARILLRRSASGDSAKALAVLPSPEDSKPFRESSMAYWWIDGLRITLEAQRLIDVGRFEKAPDAINALTHHGIEMAERQKLAASLGEITQWNRSSRAIELLVAELNGRLALSGPPAGLGSAFNWFRAAADRQKPTTMLDPPPVLTPMAMRLGDYFLARNLPHEAVKAYEEALDHFPGDAESMIRLKNAQQLAEAGDPESEKQDEQPSE